MEEILHQLVGSLSYYLQGFMTIPLVQQIPCGVPLMDEPMPAGMNFGAPLATCFSPVDFWQTPKNIQRRRLTAGT